MISAPVEVDRRVSYPPALEGCLESLERCIRLVSALQEQGFFERSQGDTTFGAHLRHCLDHYHCLLRGLETGLVDYDARERDRRLEKDPQRMLQVLRQLRDRLELLAQESMSRELAVRQQASSGSLPVTVRSCLEREWIFLSSHTIHHLEILFRIAKDYGFAVDPALTLAFSTATWNAKQSSTGSECSSS